MQKLLGIFLSINYLFVQLSFAPSIPLSWSKALITDSLETVVIVVHDIGLGAGVIIAKDGTTLTAAHVVSGEDLGQIWIITRDDIQSPVEVCYLDTRKDLAIIRPTQRSQDFKYAQIQTKDMLYAGQDILVIGHPLENYFTITSGVISKVFFAFRTARTLMDITALIRPGNSGGPIFDTHGKIIGIVSAMYVTWQGEPTGIGIGVALPTIKVFLNDYYKAKLPNKQIKRYRLGDIK
jgi:S1-C subfamily serine protease